MFRRIPLETAAEEICITTSRPPLIFQLPPAEGRRVLDTIQNAPVCMAPASIKSVCLDTGKWGKITVHMILPDNLIGTPNTILYIHGAGWVFGNLHTHEKLVRELAYRSNSIVVFPEYSLSPEARYPTAIEQCYCLLCSLPQIIAQESLVFNERTLTVAGDSAGGNIAAALTLMAKMRKGPKIQKQLLYYPVTNACFDTCSYEEFSFGYYLFREGMKWFWDQYAPFEATRREVTASPLCSNLQLLSNLPDAMIITGEADVLRDEGEAYAKKLRMAGVDVTAIRIQGIIHDFVMLNSLDKTNACRTAMDASTEWLNRKNYCAQA